MSSTAAGLSTTFELGSSAFHRAPSKPWAPPQGITLLDGGFARNKNARAESKPHLEWHPRRLPAGAAQLHAGVSPWDHASPKLRATLSNMSTYDHLERRLKYHRRGRVELSMLRGMLADYYAAWHEEQSLPPSAGFPRGVLHQYYLVSDERQGVRGFLCVVLEPAGKINGGGSVAGRVEHNLAAFYWLDAVEGNEAALREEREKLRRRKAREERLAHEQMAAMQAERAAAAAAAEEAAAEAAAAEKRMRREEMARRVKAVQRRMLTQIQNRGATTSVYSLGQTFAAMDQDKSFTLDRQEIAGGMLKQGLELTENEIDLLLNFYDNDGRGQLNYTELVEALKGEFNERRHALVQRAFAQLDPEGRGTVALDAIAASYHAAEHPDVKSRRRTEAEVLREFLLGFERQANAQGAVTLPQFERYFSMLSRTIDDDEYFATMMRHAWGVAESYY